MTSSFPASAVESVVSAAASVMIGEVVSGAFTGSSLNADVSSASDTVKADVLAVDVSAPNSSAVRVFSEAANESELVS